MTRTLVRTTTTAFAAGLLVTGLTACSSGDGTTADGPSSPAVLSASASTEASAPATPLAQIPALTGTSTTVALTTDFTTALTTLQLTAAAVAPATLTGSSLVLPITGGDITYYAPGSRDPYVTGSIEHAGAGLSLTGAGKVVALTDFTVDPGGSELYADVAVNGVPVVAQTELFTLDASALQPIVVDRAAGTATLAGTKLVLSADAARLLNSTFGTDKATGGLVVGVATIVLKTG